MNVEEYQRRWEEAEDLFTVEDFFSLLPLLRDDLKKHVQTNIPSKNFLESITDEDFLNMYAEWYFMHKTKEKGLQNGLIFEAIGLRHIENTTGPDMFVRQIKELILHLHQDYNNIRLWGGKKSVPDDIGLVITDDRVVINRIFEVKLSVHAILRSGNQRENTTVALRLLVNALNGSDKKISTQPGKNIICNTRQELNSKLSLPIEISQDCRYVYVLPFNENYYPGRNNRNVEVVNAPLTLSKVEKFREKTISFFGDNFGKEI